MNDLGDRANNCDPPLEHRHVGAAAMQFAEAFSLQEIGSQSEELNSQYDGQKGGIVPHSVKEMLVKRDDD